ncbi:hypothetical protein UlMin_022228 [Ulmus minor]
MAKIFREDNYPSTIEEFICVLGSFEWFYFLMIIIFSFCGHNLFLGSAAVANNKFAMKDLNITHILNVTNCLQPLHPNDFVYKVINAGGCVFVHCFVGRFRRMTMSQALEYVRSKRSRASPNAIFIIQLQEFELCVAET